MSKEITETKVTTKSEPVKFKKSIYMDQIDYKVTLDELTKFIKSSFGDIKFEIKYIEHKGYGFIKVFDEKVYNKIMNSQNLKLHNRIIHFDVYKFYLHGIHVKGIPETMNLEEVTNIFNKFGDIEHIRMDRILTSGVHTGSCNIEYSDFESFKAVIEMREIKIGDVTLNISKRFSKNRNRNTNYNNHNYNHNYNRSYNRYPHYYKSRSEIPRKE